jgi:hypothetical protein
MGDKGDMNATAMLPSEIIELLKEMASQEDPNDEIDGDDSTGHELKGMCGDDIEEAYGVGAQSGRVGLARRLCEMLAIEYTVEEE